MSTGDLTQFLIYVVALTILAIPLGTYMAKVYAGLETFLSPLLAPVEIFIYKRVGTITGIDPTQEMNWKNYALSMITFNALGLLMLYGLQRIQHLLPLNPEVLPPVEAHTAFNAAVSFTSNTNWQSYGGETTLSYLSQMIGMTAQNFLSAATGMAILVAFIRGFSRENSRTIGNFWVDLVRSLLYILLPLSAVLAIFLISQGVAQTFSEYIKYTPLELAASTIQSEENKHRIALGPVASQVAIKQLGTNGGGFFNSNSAHPIENPTPLTNFAEMLAILLIPAGLCHTFGHLCGDRKQGWAIFVAMLTMFIASFALCYIGETKWSEAKVQDQFIPIGNMEGKEVRFGIVNSCIWATATTAASNGSVNSMHDSYSPLGSLPTLVLMQLGEVVFGGVGCGLYGMIVYAIIAVFIAGLMVGRTPEYLGKKIEAYEMKMSSLILLIPPALVLIGTAVAVSNTFGTSSILNPGPHGFSEILYAFSSAGNNNGSAFAGLNANTEFYNIALGVCMFISRYWLAIATLALAGSLVAKKRIPSGPGTLKTCTPLFIVLLIGVVAVFGLLTFVPALSLGPIVEHLRMVN